MEYITKEGLQTLHKELDELKTTKRTEIARRLKEAASFGDLSENAEYMEVKEEQAFVEGRIAELEDILRNAQLVKKLHEPKAGTATVGCGIDVMVDKKIRNFLLVGNEQADPLNGKISPDSLLGKALLGRKEGDTFEITLPSGKKIYKVVKIA